MVGQPQLAKPAGKKNSALALGTITNPLVSARNLEVTLDFPYSFCLSHLTNCLSLDKQCLMKNSPLASFCLTRALLNSLHAPTSFISHQDGCSNSLIVSLPSVFPFQPSLQVSVSVTLQSLTWSSPVEGPSLAPVTQPQPVIWMCPGLWITCPCVCHSLISHHPSGPIP